MTEQLRAIIESLVDGSIGSDPTHVNEAVQSVKDTEEDEKVGHWMIDGVD